MRWKGAASTMCREARRSTGQGAGNSFLKSRKRYPTPRSVRIYFGFDGSGSADGRAKLFIIDSIFRRNVIYRNHYGPLVINAYKYEDLPTFGMMRSRLYHNTWYRNHEYGYEMVDNSGQNPDPHYVTGNIFQNNIFSYNDPGGDGLSLALYSNIAEDNEFNSNLLYGDKPGCKTIRYDWVFPGLTEWKGLAMTAEEANELKPRQFRGNIDAEPGFLDPEADDYRLRPDSPCIDAGPRDAPVGDEPQPHGGRVNLGAYGGTSQASLHLASGALIMIR